MSRKKFFLMIAMIMMVPMSSLAQWRVGVNIGGDYNSYSRDVHYMSDFHYKGSSGVALGATAQYDFFDWFGLRADLVYLQKNHNESRKQMPMDYDIINNYLQLPVMASFSFGGSRLRGFMNLGLYGGYWTSSRQKGDEYIPSESMQYDIDVEVTFSDTRDQRWDFGLVAGAGLEYRFAQQWAAQMEIRHYYSTTSITKDYMYYKDPRYNSTTAFTIGVQYLF